MVCIIAYVVVFHQAAFLSSADFFFKINFLKRIFQKYHQIVKQFRPDRPSSGLIWVQTVCRGYQQTTLVDKEFNDICTKITIERPAVMFTNVSYFGISGSFRFTVQFLYICLVMPIISKVHGDN